MSEPICMYLFGEMKFLLLLLLLLLLAGGGR